MVDGLAGRADVFVGVRELMGKRIIAEATPLYILLTVMRQRWEARDYGPAVSLAKVAAPYLHGRAAVSRPAGELAEVSDEELERWSGGGRAAAADTDTGEPE